VADGHPRLRRFRKARNQLTRRRPEAQPGGPRALIGFPGRLWPSSGLPVPRWIILIAESNKKKCVSSSNNKKCTKDRHGDEDREEDGWLATPPSNWRAA
jgi:hypothetical protein